METVIKEDVLISQLRKELCEVKPKIPITIAATDHFRNDWNLDSLELVEFVARLEQKYRILIPDSELFELYSLKATADYINSKTIVNA